VVTCTDPSPGVHRVPPCLVTGPVHFGHFPILGDVIGIEPGLYTPAF